MEYYDFANQFDSRKPSWLIQNKMVAMEWKFKAGSVRVLVGGVLEDSLDDHHRGVIDKRVHSTAAMTFASINGGWQLQWLQCGEVK